MSTREGGSYAPGRKRPWLDRLVQRRLEFHSDATRLSPVEAREEACGKSVTRSHRET